MNPDPDPGAGADVDPAGESVDGRLRSGRCGRTGWLQVLVDHDTPGGVGSCPTCRWVSTRAQRDCPSRVIAKALLHHAPLPAWLAHLADQIPGARTRPTPQTRAQARAVEDALPGLFDPPTRRPEPRP